MTEGEYKLVVEELAAVEEGGTVYRLYVEANDPTDKFSAIYGNDEQPLVLTTPAGIFNSSFNPSGMLTGLEPCFSANIS